MERKMSRTIDELLNTPYWIIDILPKQVPAGGAGQYFAVEQYLRDTQLSEIKKKHVNMILKLNCYRDICLDEDGTINPPPEQIADAIYERYVNIVLDDSWYHILSINFCLASSGKSCPYNPLYDFKLY